MARSIWLFDPEELNPRGRKPELIFQAIKERYSFTPLATVEGVKPQSPTNSIKFSGGSWTVGPDVIEMELEVYNDGLVATCKSDTDHADAFIGDLLGWLRQQHASVNENYVLNPKRAYRSEIIAYFPSLTISSGLGNILTLSEHIAKGTHVALSEIEPEAVIFGSDARRGLFTFERRLGTPYSDEKYFSAAQMQTSKHIAVLKELEVILSGTPKE